MSGDHNKYQKGPAPPDYIDRRQWNYNPMTGEPLIDGWPLYSGLPQREWQGLTAKDLAEIPPSCYEGAIWADARLKEKNGG